VFDTSSGCIAMGGMSDIKHVIVLMQENRSFDEYFGTFPGARGLNDETGNFTGQYADQNGNDIQPFRMSTFTSTGLERDGAQHGWGPFQQVYQDLKNGAPHPWSTSAAGSTMGYYAANDIPYHWALASTFALCDNFFASALSGTFSNRLFLMSGTMGETSQAVGGPSGPQENNPSAYPEVLNLSWKTYPDELNDAIHPAGPPFTWTIYVEDMASEGNPVPTSTAPDSGNINHPGGTWGLNVLQQFEVWVQELTAPIGQQIVGSPQVAMQAGQFENDIAAHQLPAISWIIPPFGTTEWENDHPSDGAVYISRLLDSILQGTDENGAPYWDSTVFILVYDEAGGQFDHVLPPVANQADESVSGQPVGRLSSPGHHHLPLDGQRRRAA
jgi:phospholipase C